MPSIAHALTQDSMHTDQDTEGERLRALADYHIMDTPHEQDYDALIELIHDLLGADFTTLSFIDTERIWIKSMLGFELAQNMREGTVCSQVIDTRSDAPYEVENLREDERTRGLLLGEHYTSYVGVPIRAQGDKHIGVLSLGFVEHKKLDDRERSALLTFRRQIEVMLEQRRALHMVRQQQRAILQIAEQHQSLLSTVSHDTRNLLAGILSNCEFAVHQIDLHTDEAREAIEDALYAARQARQMLEHIDESKRRFRQETPVNLRAIREEFRAPPPCAPLGCQARAHAYTPSALSEVNSSECSRCVHRYASQTSCRGPIPG